MLMKYNQKYFTLVVIVGILLVFYVQYFNKKLLPNTATHQPFKNGNNTVIGGTRYGNDFADQFCWISRSKSDWRAISSSCEEFMSWETGRKLSPLLETDSNKTFVSMIDLKPAGEISKIFITTKTRQGFIKTIGGDSWRVKINGTATISVSVLDYGNGTYEIAFLCYDFGVYFVSIYLDYSLCNGLKNPPKDWFIRGNSQGKYQGVDVIGKPKDFLMAPLKGTPIKILIEERRIQVPARDNSPKNRRDLAEEKPAGHLLVYGDSVNVFFAQSLQHRYKICRKLFRSCGFSYNWIYQVENVSLAKKQRDKKDFNITKILDDFKRVVFVPKYNNRESIVIVNFGLHYVESTNFSNYELLIEGFAKLITNQNESGEERFMGNIIWKTTTAINKERADYPQLHWRRFFTNHRIQLYNAYATNIMCQYSIPIIDAYAISESYPFGTGTHAGRSAARNDIVHYNNEAFYPIEESLENIFVYHNADIDEVNGKSFS
eukprot:gene3340-1689_t